MDFKINGENKKLNFGVRFVANIDESEKYEAEGISFGMGLMLVQQKLNMGNLEALTSVIKHALYKENVTKDEVMDALDEYAEENDLEVLIQKIEGELKNSNAVRTARARMEKMTTETNRQKGLTAVK